MAPPDRIERALTSSGVIPAWGPMIVVAARSAAAISALRTVDHSSTLKTAARCVSGGAPCCCKCVTRSGMAATEHVQGCPVTPFPIDSPLTPFFCVVKRRLTKVSEAQVEGETLVAWMGWVPTKNWMSLRVKGVDTVYFPPAPYSPVRMRKENAIQSRSAIAFPLGDLPWETESMQWRIDMGRGSTLPGGGIFFRVVRKLSYQAKIDGDHGVESWVWGPHGHKYLSHGADVLIHASFVDDIVVWMQVRLCRPCEQIYVGRGWVT